MIVRVLFVALSLALLVATAAAGQVPDVTGLSAPEGRTLLDQGGFRVELVYDPAAERDLIVAQDPPAFSDRPPGSVVRLRVGGSPPPVGGEDPAAATGASAGLPGDDGSPTAASIPDAPIAPDLIGLTLSEAQARADRLPLRVEQSLAQVDLVGRIVNQWPSATRPVPPGEDLVAVLGVASLPSPRHRVVPALEGLTLEQARSVLAQEDLQIAAAGATGPAATALRILRQSPLSGSLAIQGSAVTVVVGSGGSALAPVPVAIRAPDLLAPEEGAIRHRTERIALDWTPVEGATAYVWRVEQEGGGGHFTAAAGEETTQSWVRDLSLPPGQYRWHVRAIGTGASSPPSPARRLYVY